MSEKVLIKRLPHCFQVSQRTLKLEAALAYLQMFPAEKRQELGQYDEKLEDHYKEYDIAGIYDGTITDKNLDEFLNDGQIPTLVKEEHYHEDQVIKLPKRATDGAAGYDLQAAIDESIWLNPGEYKLIPTGLSVSMPKDLEMQVRPRSGLAAKYGVTVLNAPGTIDSDYGGEIKVILINHGKEAFVINRGDRIAQAVFNIIALPTLTEVDSLEKTTRGSGGFGSTGVK